MESNRIRQSLAHPVVDSDGHMIESFDLFAEHLDDVGGPGMVDRYRQELRERPVGSFGDLHTGEPRSGFWGFPNDARDVATAMVPELLYARLGELGFDFAVVYPSMGIPATTIQDPEVRRAALRAENTMNAVRFAPLADRLTPAAAIPMHTPQEAVDELRYAHTELGLKVAVIPPGVARPIPAYRDAFPAACTVDRFGLDSAFDYDPVWQAFSDLGVAVTAHVGAALRYLPSGRHSPTNFCFNHIGAHAYAQAELCRALVMGGVPARFPDLAFGFLEGGIGWAVDMLESMVEHWEKRNLDAMRRNLDPAGLDADEFRSLVRQYGERSFARIGTDAVQPPTGNFATSRTMAAGRAADATAGIDEWAASGVTTPEDLVRPFVDNFFFGCEAEDRSVVRAFGERRRGQPGLRPLFGSDIGHYDVTRMDHVLAESYEFVASGDLEPGEWEEFVCGNALRFWTAMDPDFFVGTAVEAPAAAALAAGAGKGG